MAHGPAFRFSDLLGPGTPYLLAQYRKLVKVLQDAVEKEDPIFHGSGGKEVGGKAPSAKNKGGDVQSESKAARRWSLPSSSFENPMGHQLSFVRAARVGDYTSDDFGGVRYGHVEGERERETGREREREREREGEREREREGGRGKVKGVSLNSVHYVVQPGDVAIFNAATRRGGRKWADKEILRERGEYTTLPRGGGLDGRLPLAVEPYWDLKHGPLSRP